MDFVTLWKTTSIVLTGLFGMLGLLTHYRDKQTDRITKWGRLSLIGIIVSSTCGVVAQLKEASNQEKSREATLSRTLELAQKTDQTVHDIHRALSPFEDPHFSIDFYASCDNVKFKAMCAASHIDDELPANFSKWPTEIPGEMGIGLYFFVEAKDAQTFLSKAEPLPDLGIPIMASVQNKILSADRLQDYVDFSIWEYAPFANRGMSKPGANGKIASIDDLAGATLIIAPTTDVRLEDLSVDRFVIEFKNGRRIVVNTTRLEKVKYRGELALRYVFEKPLSG